MTKIVFIGIGAGVAAAFLLMAGRYATLYSGSFAPILLIYLCPLPILIAGLAFSHWAALIAALCAGVSLALAFGSMLFLFFLVVIGLPAWWLTYLSLLARPAERPTPDGMEWYPIGRIVLWTAALGGLLVVVTIPFIGADPETFRATLREAVTAALGPERGALGEIEVTDVILDAAVLTVPPMLAVFATLIQIINLWLAARIVKTFGHLRRPWPELPALGFPPLAPAFLAAAIVGIFLPGFFGIIGGIFAASLTIAYAILGMAVLHSVTRGVDGRPILLGLFYAIFVIFTGPALVLASGLALADTALDLRGRAARKSGPPTLRM
jgi:hypothetical protein